MGVFGMLKRAILPYGLLAASATTILDAGNADALLVLEFIQQGSDVALNASGSLSGLPSHILASANYGSIVYPEVAIISTQSFSTTDSRSYKLDGPVDFGPGSNFPLSYTGNSFALWFGNYINLPNSYVEGDPITGTGLISGQTLASLGLSSTSGLLGTWTVGTDSIEVWAGAKPSATVPGPLPLLGASAAFAFSRRLRARLR